VKYYTGNEYISLIKVKEDMSINGISALSMDLNGNLFLDCIMKLRIFVDEEEIDLTKTEFELINYWIPNAKITYNGIEFTITILAPNELRGFIYNIKILNKSLKSFNIKIESIYSLKDMYININSSYKLNAEKIMYFQDWFKGAILSIRSYKNIFALAFLADEPNKFSLSKDKTAFNMSNNIHIAVNESKIFNYYIGAGLEDISALYSSIYLKRLGYDKLFKKSKDWLGTRVCNIKEKHLEKICNINSFFNYFFAYGRCIDTEELVAVTSRSPEYYVSGAYWDRDCLLWSFPGILEIDKQRAKDILLYIFKTQTKNFGIHSRFINGTVLEPGFELDGLCAPYIALECYIKETGDRKFLQEEFIYRELLLAEKRFKNWKNENNNIYKTELRPSDDPCKYEYNTYDNVLVWKAFGSIHFLLNCIGQKGLAKHFLNMARKVKNAIKKYAIIKKDRLIAYEFDLNDNYKLYEEPAGSLRLLDYFGFIDVDLKVYYENTLKWSYSVKNENFFETSLIKESGSLHAMHPWALSGANSLLVSEYENFGLEFFRKSIMDDYIACESVDEKTGLSITGNAFATCAGFIAYTLKKYCGKKHI